MAEYAIVAFAASGPDGAARLAAVASACAPPDSRPLRSDTRASTWLYAVRPGRGARDLAEDVRGRLASTLGAAVAAGVAGPSARETDGRALVLQAEQALFLGRALYGDGRTTHFEDLGPYCFVLGRPTRDMRAFCARILGPLADDADLVRTLEEYLRSHGSVQTVADRLFLHRNTVRMRLRRIAQLTRADLKDADDRLALQLAILTHRALERLAS